MSLLPLYPRRRFQASVVILSISVPAFVSVYVGCQSVISLSEELYKNHTFSNSLYFVEKKTSKVDRLFSLTY